MVGRKAVGRKAREIRSLGIEPQIGVVLRENFVRVAGPLAERPVEGYLSGWFSSQKKSFGVIFGGTDGHGLKAHGEVTLRGGYLRPETVLRGWWKVGLKAAGRKA